MKPLGPLLLILAAACKPEPAPPSASASPEPSASAATVPASASAVAPAFPKGAFPCGSATCEVFDDPAAAFAAVIERDEPLVLALGESHAQKGSESIRSTAARFTDDLLPKLAGKASSLVLELWVADPSCDKKKVAEVKEAQKAVTKGQAEGNQNEFVRLGEKSRSLDIVPFILKPSCAEYDRIKKAGDDAILEMLSMITRNMRDKTKALFAETEKKAPGKMVVTYGGAMHNDRAPGPGREDWSFAKDLDELSRGRYVELDLVVPEFIKDNDSWRKLPWYEAYDPARFDTVTVLIATGPRSYALIFPRTRTH